VLRVAHPTLEGVGRTSIRGSDKMTVTRARLSPRAWPRQSFTPTVAEELLK